MDFFNKKIESNNLSYLSMRLSNKPTLVISSCQCLENDIILLVLKDSYSNTITKNWLAVNDVKEN